MSRPTKYQRQLLALLKALNKRRGDLKLVPHKGHWHIVEARTGKRLLTTSGSPKNTDHALLNVKRDLDRYLN